MDIQVVNGLPIYKWGKKKQFLTIDPIFQRDIQACERRFLDPL